MMLLVRPCASGVLSDAHSADTERARARRTRQYELQEEHLGGDRR